MDQSYTPAVLWDPLPSFLCILPIMRLVLSHLFCGWPLQYHPQLFVVWREAVFLPLDNNRHDVKMAIVRVLLGRQALSALDLESSGCPARGIVCGRGKKTLLHLSFLLLTDRRSVLC